MVVGDAEQLKLLGMPALIRQSVQRDDRPVDDMEATEVALTQEEEQVGQWSVCLQFKSWLLLSTCRSVLGQDTGLNCSR